MLPRLYPAHEQAFRSRTLMASLDPHALAGHPLHRSCRVLRSLPAQKRSARIALLRRRKAPRRALGQICATHLEMERRFAKEAPGPLRKIFQESRLISLAPASAVFSSHRGTGSGGRSLERRSEEHTSELQSHVNL